MRKKTVLTILSVLLFSAILAGSIILHDPVSFGEFSTVRESDNWDYEEETDMVSGYQVLTFSKEITSWMAGKTLCFETENAYVYAEINGSSIYHFGQKPLFGKSPGTWTNFIKIPEGTGGRIITIQVTSVYAESYPSSYSITIGTTDELIFHLISSEQPAVNSCWLMILIGITIMGISAINKRSGTDLSHLFWLGLLSIDFAIYCFCYLFQMQYLTHSPILRYYLHYLSLYCLPVLALEYFGRLLKTDNSKLQDACLCFIVIILILHFTGLQDLTDSLSLAAAGIIITIVAIAYEIIQNYRTLPKVEKIAILWLFIMVSLNVITYLIMPNFEQRTIISEIGFIVYIIFALVQGIQAILERSYQLKEAELLKSIAFTDNLTQLGNRYALETYVKNKPLQKMAVISFDLNSLKYYNDTFGHSAGDQLLKMCAVCLKEVYVHVYRTGGDEFVSVLFDKDRSSLDQLHQWMIDKAKDITAENPGLTLSIASGYAFYEDGDQSYEDILKRADLSMYQDKHRMHAERRDIAPSL